MKHTIVGIVIFIWERVVVHREGRINMEETLCVYKY